MSVPFADLRALAEAVAADRQRVLDGDARGEKLWCSNELVSRWNALVTPHVVLALLDALKDQDANQRKLDALQQQVRDLARLIAAGRTLDS